MTIFHSEVKKTSQQREKDKKTLLKYIMSVYKDKPADRVWVNFMEKYGGERTAKVFDPNQLKVEIPRAGVCILHFATPGAQKEFFMHNAFLHWLKKEFDEVKFVFDNSWKEQPISWLHKLLDMIY